MMTYDGDSADPMSIKTAFEAEAAHGTFCVDCIVFAAQRLDDAALCNVEAGWPSA